MDEPGKAAEDEELWRFSLAFYERPGVAAALIALQDRDGCDVNLMLFALWLGISGRGTLGKGLLAAAERETGALRDEIISPLRSLRRKLRRHPDGDVQQLRDGVKALELEGEKLVLRRLDRLVGCRCARILPENRRADAHVNLALVLGTETVCRGEAAVILKALDAFAQDLYRYRQVPPSA